MLGKTSISSTMAFIAVLTTAISRTRPTLALSMVTFSTTSRLSAFGKPFATKTNSFQRNFHKSSSASSILKMSSLAVTETLEKSLEVTHPSYEVVSKDVVTEYGAYCTLYRHKKTGAELLSVANDDDNKVFGITFRTPPSDSTGVPHILEHSVLCGSRKYTTKDPFVQLLQGSLQNFLNAFTYPDRTCYVVASQNLKDFYNLVNVYSDAVFHPRAVSDPNVHAQEGWHLELDDKENPLVYKGVVYNEMKGVYSSPDSLLMRESQQSIFTKNTYGVDSGGDPKVIPDLSYEQFVDFHAKYYHPANSRIYFSGDDEVYERLELMDEYLNDFDASPDSKVKSEIEWQPKTYTEIQRLSSPYPSGGDQEDTHMVQMNWLVNDKPLTSTEELTIAILDHLILGTTSSILRKTLMESGLGSSITGGGLSDELLQVTYSVGLKDVKPENVEAVEELITSTLQKIVSEGFSEDAIASSMNTLEFQMREFNTGSFPKGLMFMLGSMSKWIYGDSPTKALKFEEPLKELKDAIAKDGSKVFTDMIQTYFLDNKHCSIVNMVPSKTLEEEEKKEEEERLQKIKDSLKDEDIEEIIKNTAALKEMQAADDTPESLATIPKLSLADLKREVTEYPIDVTENENDSGVTVVRHEMVSTSGIAYVDFGVDVSGVSLEDTTLLPIFTRILLETGAGEYDDVQLSRRIGTHTGGINVNMALIPVEQEGEDGVILDGNHFMTKLFVKGKATSDKTDELLDTMKLILTEAKLDSQSKVIEMLKESKSRIESGVQSAGHSFSNNRMKSRYTPLGCFEEKISGITYLETVKKFLKEAEEDWPSMLARLQRIKDAILDEKTCRNGMVLNLTGDKVVLNTIQPSVDSFLNELPGDSKGESLINFYKEDHPWVEGLRKEMAAPEDEGFVVPTQVSYVGKGGLLYQPGEEVSGSTMVISRYLSRKYLWDYVRVIGGAYGGFCQFSPNDGFFSFLSYRDPNLGETIDVYDNTPDVLTKQAADLETNKEELEKAIIGAIGDMDGPKSNDQKGWISLQRWLKNESPETRQRLRDEVLKTTAKDFKEFAERLRGLNGSVAVVSSKSAVEGAKKDGKDLKVIEVF